MKNKLEDAKGFWMKELPEILWAIKTTLNSAIKNMHFTLAFEHEAVIPTEIGVNTLKVFEYNADDNDERLKLDLEMIDYIRDEAQVRAAMKRQEMAN